MGGGFSPIFTRGVFQDLLCNFSGCKRQSLFSTQAIFKRTEGATYWLAYRHTSVHHSQFIVLFNIMVANDLRLQVQLAPAVFLGSYGTLLNQVFIDHANVKVVVNCGATSQFIQFLDLLKPAISSDVVVLNLDPRSSKSDESYKEFHNRFNKILQNYLTFFYSYNENVNYFIHSNFENSKLAFESPTMNGQPLKLLFNINRLLMLLRNVNSSIGVLFVAENFGHRHHSNSLLFSLAMLYLMDNYNYNFEASYKYLKSLLPQRILAGDEFLSLGNYPIPELFNFNYYDDLLLIDSLKKFLVENRKIKQQESGVMTKNFKLKRPRDAMDSVSASTAVKRKA